MIISTKFPAGQKVRFLRRCVLASNVPSNSSGYKYTALRVADDDKYEGEGIIDPGTFGVVVGYASHGSGASDNPVVRVKGHLASTNTSNIELA